LRFFLSSVPKNLAVMRFFIFHVPKIADLLSNSGSSDAHTARLSQKNPRGSFEPGGFHM